MARTPLWRAPYDRAESVLAPRLEQILQGDSFARTITIAMRLRAQAQRWTATQTSRMWHLANLPASSDVARLREQLASLDRQVGRLVTAFEEGREEVRDADATDATDHTRHARSGKTRGGEERAPRQ
jgi:hypothetical protein